MRAKLIIAIAGGFFTLLALAIFYLFGSATVSIPLPEGVESALVTIEGRKINKIEAKLPVELRLRSGLYLITANSQGFEPHVSRVRVISGWNKIIKIELSHQEFDDLHEIVDVPYLELFPYITGDFELQAILDDTEPGQRKRIAKIQLTVFHRFMSPSDGELYEEEFRMAFEAAKQYLRDNHVPDNIPLEVIRRP